MSADININNKTEEDSDIIRRFFERDESALSDVNRKYGSYCSAIARNKRQRQPYQDQRT